MEQAKEQVAAGVEESKLTDLKDPAVFYILQAINGLHQENLGIRQEISGIRQEISGLRQEMKQEISRLTEKVERYEDRFSFLNEKIMLLREQMAQQDEKFSNKLDSLKTRATGLVVTIAIGLAGIIVVLAVALF